MLSYLCLTCNLVLLKSVVMSCVTYVYHVNLMLLMSDQFLLLLFSVLMSCVTCVRSVLPCYLCLSCCQFVYISCVACVHLLLVMPVLICYFCLVMRNFMCLSFLLCYFYLSTYLVLHVPIYLTWLVILRCFLSVLLAFCSLCLTR